MSEMSVAQAMGISGSPVRHALALLRVEGLVEVVPQRGTFVFTPDRRGLDDMAVLRTALEMGALEAAIHVDREGLNLALNSTCDAMEQAYARGDMAATLRGDTEFHAQFFEFCGNEYLKSAYGLIAHKLAAIRTQIAIRSDARADCFAKHRELLTAIRDRRIRGAEALLREHLDAAQTFYRVNLDRIFTEAPRQFRRLPAFALPPGRAPRRRNLKVS